MGDQSDDQLLKELEDIAEGIDMQDDPNMEAEDASADVAALPEAEKGEGSSDEVDARQESMKETPEAVPNEESAKKVTPAAPTKKRGLNMVKKAATPEPASILAEQPPKKKIAARIVRATPDETAQQSDAAPAADVQAADAPSKAAPKKAPKKAAQAAPGRSTPQKKDKCKHPHCGRGASFNHPMTTSRMYCSHHKKEGMVNVKKRKCRHHQCGRQASCNYTGQAPAFCPDHATEGMVQVVQGQTKTEVKASAAEVSGAKGKTTGRQPGLRQPQGSYRREAVPEAAGPADGEASASSVYATPTDVKEVLKKFQDTPENSAEEEGTTGAMPEFLMKDTYIAKYTSTGDSQADHPGRLPGLDAMIDEYKAMRTPSDQEAPSPNDSMSLAGSVQSQEEHGELAAGISEEDGDVLTAEELEEAEDLSGGAELMAVLEGQH